MSPSLDEQAAQVAGLLTVPGGAGPGMPRRFGSGDAWLVQCGGERLVLKLGRSEQDAADVTWEHDYLRRLAGTGFPASVPVSAFEGRSWVQVDGRVWAALSFLPGRPLAAQSAPDMAAAGAFLARYHRVARTLPVREQRSTAAVLSHLWVTTRWDHLRLALVDADMLARFERLLDDLEDGLHAIHYDQLEHVVIHGDPTNDNLIEDGSPPRVVGMIDFGSAHVAPWICDLAAGLWRSGRPDPNVVAYDPERIRRFVVGYHRVSPLPRELARAIPLLMEARGYQLISRRVRRLPPQADAAPMPSVLDALVRTEWLRAHRDEIEDIILDALAGECTEDGRDG